MGHVGGEFSTLQYPNAITAVFIKVFRSYIGVFGTQGKILGE